MRKPQVNLFYLNSKHRMCYADILLCVILQSSFILEPSVTVWTGERPDLVVDRDLVPGEAAHFEEGLVTLVTLVALLLIMHLPDVPLQSVELRERFITLDTLFHPHSRFIFLNPPLWMWIRLWQYFP